MDGAVLSIVEYVHWCMYVLVSVDGSLGVAFYKGIEYINVQF